MMTSQEKYIAFQTIVRKEVVRFTRIWTQTLLPPVITQTLYFVIFGKFIGSRIGDIHGVSYMTFIVPGLTMMAVINNAFANVVSSFFSSKFQRSIEELLVSPTPNWIVMSGYILGGVLRGMCVGVLVFLVSMFFALPKIHNLPIVILFIVLTSILFSIGGFINAIYAKRFDDVAIFPTFVLTPLTYLGGVFYSIQSLPEIWQNISKLNPLLYMINGFRYGFLGISDVNVFVSFLMMIVFIILFASWGLYLLNKGTGLKN